MCKEDAMLAGRGERVLQESQVLYLRALMSIGLLSNKMAGDDEEPFSRGAQHEDDFRDL